ncbi:hypothetical protein DJ71_20405 [Halorubrum sp. E3]|nr:hypothetical protein DJ71_20405 [Halorubrum sp. E3]
MSNYDSRGIETSPTTEASQTKTTLADGGEHRVLDEIDVEAAFEDVPRVEGDESTLYGAQMRFPDTIVDADTSVERIPDPYHKYAPEVEIEVPDWVVASVAWQLSQQHDPDEAAFRDIIFEIVEVRARFVTSDGENLTELLLNGEEN